MLLSVLNVAVYSPFAGFCAAAAELEAALALADALEALAEALEALALALETLALADVDAELDEAADELDAAPDAHPPRATMAASAVAATSMMMGFFMCGLPFLPFIGP